MCREIAQIDGKHEDTVRRALKRSNVVMRSYRDYSAAKINDDYFATIDTEQKAYWLGFITADGCISQSAGDLRAFHFNLKRSDRQTIMLFVESIKYDGGVRDFTSKNKKTGKIYYKSGVDFNNRVFCLHLLSKGWDEFKKLDNPRLFTELPNELKRHFVRGFFDGDGCISRNKTRFKSHYISFAGSYNILSAIEDYLVISLGFKKKYPKKSKRHKVYRIGWNGNRQVDRFGEWIYKDATFWLERKKLRFKIVHDYYDGLPNIEFDDFNNFRYPLSSAEVRALTPERKLQLSKHFERLISSRPWRPPEFSEIELAGDYQRIKLERAADYLVEHGFNSHKTSNMEFSGKKILLHFQPHYWTTRYRSDKTIVEGWGDRSVRAKAVYNLFHTPGGRIGFPRYIRELNFAGARRVSHFHPGFAKAILSHFAPDAKTFLDPCAGWGARLLAASALGLEYTACDPSQKTYEGLQRMAELFGFKPTLFCKPFEEFSSGLKYDIIFTSPPYFNIEQYKYGKQSYNGKRSYPQWFSDFLLILTEKCLLLSDIVILHVSPKIKDSLLQVYPHSLIFPTHISRTAGMPKSCEWLVQLKN
jgi:hypothetical protein